MNHLFQSDNVRKKLNHKQTGIFFCPSFAKLANITRMYTIVQISSSKFLLDELVHLNQSKKFIELLGKTLNTVQHCRLQNQVHNYDLL